MQAKLQAAPIMDQENIQYITNANFSFLSSNALLKSYPTMVDIQTLHRKAFIPLIIPNNSENKICISRDTPLETCEKINCNHYNINEITLMHYHHEITMNDTVSPSTPITKEHL